MGVAIFQWRKSKANDRFKIKRTGTIHGDFDGTSLFAIFAQKVRNTQASLTISQINIEIFNVKVI